MWALKRSGPKTFHSCTVFAHSMSLPVHVHVHCTYMVKVNEAVTTVNWEIVLVKKISTINFIDKN